MSSNAAPSHSADYAFELGSDFEFDIDNALSGSLMYNFPSFTLQGEAQEHIPTSLTTHEYRNLGKMGSRYSANLPLSTTCPASLDKPFEPELQGHKGQSSFGRPDRFFLSGSIDVRTSLEEGSAFLEANNLINAVANGNKSDQSPTSESCTRNGRLCCCSISLNTLQVLCFHPVLSQVERCPPLDFILLLEDYTSQLYTAVLRCSTCQSKSLHSLLSLCICTDLIIEMLRRVIQNSLSYREHGVNGKVGFDRPENGSSVCFGQACLDDQLRQSCVRRLLKHRVSKLAAVVGRVARLGYRSTGSLEEAFDIAIKGVLCKTDSLLGMMEV
ncbi:hypothetical protein HBI56_025070 [Parastagonospora nodorum]|uniref:Aflatoxin regulatory protein domain-containing protein n=1 Tax=Phaeosphaeria nodorum (strain SN15 / ATCC MYA-4574 / FGSC 10173) TaxID=321614 RepID=A0A7U2EXN6_PHANO|nr:hypothetical protein HBH56_012740 [Parastagonospora nodorum]QRC94806.1 hypothetical protein JI435_025600 [Parastagonospora nodorum SN15]KAH3937359.1 hypothetical protein HBH54_021710 [Parastagonospora nodorum]KAH3953767.1 hypothetical protein HBH53_034110 [Parastagonospora nodorum]KAH3969481.1 hypothetical protein HBH51_126260 [Parastagonospora nodorum]